MSTAASISPDIAAILADVTRLGVTLQAGAGKIRFRPRSAMTPDLAQRIRTHRSELLALLSDTTPAVEDATASDDAESEVSSVVSASKQRDGARRGRGLWSEEELALLARAGLTPADTPLVSAVKDAFADFGATVVSVKTACECGGWTRRRAAELIRAARRHDAIEAVAMREAWRERTAICTIDGGLTEEQAERVALDELRDMLYSKIR